MKTSAEQRHRAREDVLVRRVVLDEQRQAGAAEAPFVAVERSSIAVLASRPMYVSLSRLRVPDGARGRAGRRRSGAARASSTASRASSTSRSGSPTATPASSVMVSRWTDRACFTAVHAEPRAPGLPRPDRPGADDGDVKLERLEHMHVGRSDGRRLDRRAARRPRGDRARRRRGTTGTSASSPVRSAGARGVPGRAGPTTARPGRRGASTTTAYLLHWAWGIARA